MSNVGVKRGNLLYMEWQIPLNAKPAEHVVLGINGVSIDFLRNDEIIGFFNGQDEELYLIYENEKWFYRLIVENYEWLPNGENIYEFIVLGIDNALLVSDEGTVTVYA
jgi:hypothetical protein